MPRRALLVTVLALGATAYACGARTPLQGGPVSDVFDAGDDPRGPPPRAEGGTGSVVDAGPPRDSGTDAEPPADVPDADVPDADVPDAGRPSNIVSLTAGGEHNCALSGDGRAWCWGSNVVAQLGDGKTIDRASATEVAGLGTATAIGAYDLFSCAVVADPAGGNHVACWGCAVDQRLGSVPADPDPPYGTAPVTVPGLSGVLGLSQGSTAAHACAITSPSLYCWGSNRWNQLARGSPSDAEGPGPASGGSDTHAAAGAWTETCTVDVRGYLACSGDPYRNGQRMPTALLTAVSGVEDARAVGTGLEFGCVLLADGRVACWGGDDEGQLGGGTPSPGSAVRSVQGLSNVANLAVGAKHACAATYEGKVLCWGRNHDGQLGNGARANATEPVEALIDDVVEIAAGNSHTCARRASGSVACWGANLHGQLGNGTFDDSTLPVDVLGLP